MLLVLRESRSAADHGNPQQKVSKMIQPSDVYRLETAQEALCLLMALRSESIFHERKKAQPDTEIIEQWKAERNVLCDLPRSLHSN